MPGTRPAPENTAHPDRLSSTVLANDRLTPTSHWQDVRHLILDVPNLHPHDPGDTLTIYPQNFPSDVDELIEMMGWALIADEPLKFSHSPSASPGNPLPLAHVSPDGPITLRELLTSHLDIMAIPRRSFFSLIAHFTHDDFHRDRLLEFTDPVYLDELYDYTTRPRRSILEVLQEFSSVRLPWRSICSILPPLRGRQFSIASAVPPNATRNTPIELLVAIVKYRTVLKRIRHGVCSRYIASLERGQSLPVVVHRGSLGARPSDVDRPTIMVGPGTGVAPMRALTHQRRFWREARLQRDGPGTFQPDARDILFFGCRNAQADFFFQHEWRQLTQDVPLDVFAAFSRDQVSSATPV